MHGVADSKGGEFVVTRVFDAPRPAVWDAWTRADQLGRWFGPKGVRTTITGQDLREGGILHARIEAPDGGRLWVRFAYRAIEARARLVWVHSFSDEAANVTRAPFDAHWPLDLLTTVTFADEGLGTRVTLAWAPMSATDMERQTFAASMDLTHQGWTGSFEALDAVLASER